MVSGFLAKLALGILPRRIPIRLHAHSTAIDTIMVTWSIDHGVLDILRRLPYGINLGRRLVSALLKHVASPVNNNQFLLHLDRLPDPMRTLINHFSITRITMPSADHCLSLMAIPRSTPCPA